MKKNDEFNLGKLKRVLKSLKITRHVKLTLTVDYISMEILWVGASYNFHKEHKGHTGSTMSLGKVAAVSS